MLYQQNQKIEVIVRKVDEGAELTGANETAAGETAQAEGESSPTKKAARMSRRTKRIIVTNATHIFAVAKQVALLELNYRIGTIGVRNGDEALQDSVQRQVEVINDGFSITSSFAMGAVYGAWGGIPGMIIGSVTNGVSAIASVATKYKKRGFEYSTKLFKEENGINYLRARSSVNLTTGRLR